MIRRAARSTLFPYTTLFRSDRVRAGHGDGAGAGACGRRRLGGVGARVAIGAVILGGPRPGGRVLSGAGGERDRKSTRLNSSHMSISYAVFCLKKKKSEGYGI